MGGIGKHLAQSMAAEVPHNRAALPFRVALNGVTDVAQRCPGADLGDAAHQGLVGHLNQPAGLEAGVADQEHTA